MKIIYRLGVLALVGGLAGLASITLASITLAQTTSARHMIAAANPYAAQAGLDMLARGGSAVDAAIAAQMVLNLVEP